MEEEMESLTSLAKKYEVFLLNDEEEEHLGALNENLDQMIAFERLKADSIKETRGNGGGNSKVFTFNKKDKTQSANMDFSSANSNAIVGTRLSVVKADEIIVHSGQSQRSATDNLAYGSSETDDSMDSYARAMLEE